MEKPTPKVTTTTFSETEVTIDSNESWEPRDFAPSRIEVYGKSIKSSHLLALAKIVREIEAEGLLVNIDYNVDRQRIISISRKPLDDNK